MRLNFREEHFQNVEVKGIPCLFNDMRIDRKTVPENLFVYEVADGESDGIPARVKENIFVNFFGTLITEQPLPLEEGVMWLDEEDWSWVE